MPSNRACESCGVRENETAPARVVRAVQCFLGTRAKTAAGLCEAIANAILVGYRNGANERRITNKNIVYERSGLLAAAKDAVREWRLHGQLTDSCRLLERAIVLIESHESGIPPDKDEVL